MPQSNKNVASDKAATVAILAVFAFLMNFILLNEKLGPTLSKRAWV